MTKLQSGEVARIIDRKQICESRDKWFSSRFEFCKGLLACLLEIDIKLGLL